MKHAFVISGTLANITYCGIQSYYCLRKILLPAIHPYQWPEFTLGIKIIHGTIKLKCQLFIIYYLEWLWQVGHLIYPLQILLLYLRRNLSLIHISEPTRL